MPFSTDKLPPFEPALRVLVADDNELNQLVVCRALEDWNVEVALADNGRQAVELATAQTFDAILMDVQMPEMDGYEATRRLRSYPPLLRLPIIGLTASASAEDQALALAAGMNATLAKPFDPALLHASLAHYTRLSAQAATQQRETTDPDAPIDGRIEPDWSILEELASGNEAFIAQIITTFLQQTPALYQELVLSSTDSGSAVQARVAHKLKGQVVYFGVPALQVQLEQLERPGTSLSAASSQQLVDSIGKHLSLLYPQLESRLQQHSS
ncbi:response regulator [Hymenobacter sp. BT635]|uniref:Response regulator n=1 Tax=Hymenobacter nitidus TaxID=2880929 RepID=A0ABS8A6J9_9BACT|nr:response regulator [Hymenobacter nitidus]MCB2376033.1 response regulator [Hymenobacter nitidus]